MSHPRNVLSGAVVAGGPVVVTPAFVRPKDHPGVAGPRTYEHGRAEGLRVGQEQGRKEGFQKGLEQGRQEGREEGLAAGRDTALAELAQARQALAEAVAQLTSERRRFLAEAREGLCRLALAVARKVVHGEVGATAEVAARVVDDAIACAHDATIVHVRVNPKDKATLEQDADDSGIPLVADPSVARGGCIVETDCGAVDATIDSQWDIVEAALSEAVALEAAEEGAAEADSPEPEADVPEAPAAQEPMAPIVDMEDPVASP